MSRTVRRYVLKLHCSGYINFLLIRIGRESLFLTIKNDLLRNATNSCVLLYLRRCIFKIKILKKDGTPNRHVKTGLSF
jgi:hypothetical protein